jgi:xylan 1,4-beta-xylosidase
VLLTNHAQPRHDIVTERVEVRLTDAPRPLAAYIERIDEDHANPRRRWREIGEPEYPSPSQVEQFEAASRLVKERLGVSYEDRTVRFAVDLPPHALAAVTLELAPEPSEAGAVA